VKALSSLQFLKEKQAGKIKGQACINVAPQGAYISKEDAPLLAVLTKSTFITAAFDAHRPLIGREPLKKAAPGLAHV
jgi:hypothetical protein